MTFNHALGFKCSFGVSFHGDLKFLFCDVFGAGAVSLQGWNGREIVRMQQEWFGSERGLGCSEGDELSGRNVMQEG